MDTRKERTVNFHYDHAGCSGKNSRCSENRCGDAPIKNGLGDRGTVAAAKLAGADQFVIGNGVSIIAGFAQGTNSIPEVDGIYGPGPGGIAAAMSVAMTYGKKSVLGIGPTECVIFADETARSVKNSL